MVEKLFFIEAGAGSTTLSRYHKKYVSIEVFLYPSFGSGSRSQIISVPPAPAPHHCFKRFGSLKIHTSRTVYLNRFRSVLTFLKAIQRLQRITGKRLIEHF